MKRAFILIMTGLSTLTACTTTSTAQEPMSGMANPASVFCVKSGGESIIRKDEQGNEYGVCRFKDGTEVDEWDFYRNSHK